MINITAKARLTNLTRLRKAVGDTEPVVREVGISMERELKRNIILEGIWGTKWPREAPNTVVKKKYEGKPAGLLRGLLPYVYSTVGGATQTTFGFRSKYARMHHEGRDFSWPISARNKKILFFPVAGEIVKKKAGGLYHRLKYSVGGGERVWIGRKKTRAPKTISASKWEKFNMVKAESVIHPGFQARELMPPPEIVRERSRTIVRAHLRGGVA